MVLQHINFYTNQPILMKIDILITKSELLEIIENAIQKIKLIPRIPMVRTDLPFTFKRLQFPVRLAFSMAINKAQGQSLRVAGLNLGNPCFSHGQLYVTCSRVGIPKTLYVYTPNRKTKNIVYPLALLDVSID
ncbi:uncharacterized protein LOC135137308 [Zophobas morio]|uniref:uncharacterized protein LOC135137308 n=1 Tax=Zophobas morio TaxID=2755281 RepID=UPI0030830F17